MEVAHGSSCPGSHLAQSRKPIIIVFAVLVLKPFLFLKVQTFIKLVMDIKSLTRW
jgi:hypothetical protein